MALYRRKANVEESTPPDNANNTRLSPTLARISSIDSSTKADVVQVGSHSQI